jgi:hypothetical protein
LILFQGNGRYPAQYRVSREKIKVKKEAYLDPNHTHFILVDNGTEHQFAVEIPFRAKLENTFANMTTSEIKLIAKYEWTKCKHLVIPENHLLEVKVRL